MPSALEGWSTIVGELTGAPLAVFLDFDGTLSPIVDRPDDAQLLDGTQSVIRRLADVATVAIVSGRGADDVASRVGIDGIHIAGSHGFEIVFPDGRRHHHPDAAAAQPALDACAARLDAELSGVAGAVVETKAFGLTVHDRMVDDADLPKVRTAAAGAAADHPELRITRGKRVTELRPDVAWDKGRAVRFLLDQLADPEVRAMYVGDDRTDEDAFAVLGPDGLSVVVADPADSGRATVARFAVADPGQVRDLLERIATLLEEASPATRRREIPTPGEL